MRDAGSYTRGGLKSVMSRVLSCVFLRLYSRPNLNPKALQKEKSLCDASASEAVAELSVLTLST